jgi:SAM-dependent methyltransferase
MQTIATTATVDTPATFEQAWTLISDIPRYPEWVSGTVAVTSAPPVAVPGAVYRERNRVGPITSRSTWRVEEADRDRGTQTHVSPGSPPVQRAVVRMAVEPHQHGTRFTLTLEADVAAGPLTGLLGGLVQRVLERNSRRTMAAYHTLMAGGGTPAPSVREAIGMPVPPAPVAQVGMRVRRALGRAHDASVPPPQLVLERLFGMLDTKALHCAIELRLPELLAAGPKSPAELATAVGDADAEADADAIDRVLRYLVSRGIFSTSAGGRYANNKASDLLRGDHPHSWRPWVEFFGSEWNSRIFDRLADRVRTGRPASELAFDVPFFTYIQEVEPAAGEAFDAAMGSGSPIQALLLPDTLLDGATHLCDVGGGTGGVVANLLRRRPGMRGTVFDLEPLRERAETALAEAGVADRASFVGGDFFEAVPGGADLATMFAVLHDWDDDACVTILRNAAETLAPGGRILVVEKPLPTHDGTDFAKASDVLMLVLGDGGRERTVAEYEALFARAGLRLLERTTLPSLFDVFSLGR